MRLGIRALLAIGLSALLAVAGAIAAVVVVRLVGAAADRAIERQQRWRTAEMAAQFDDVCRDTSDCTDRLGLVMTAIDARALRQDAVDVALVSSQFRRIAGFAEGSAAQRDPLVVTSFQTRGRTWDRLVRLADHPRGAGIDHRVVVPVSLGDGRRAALRVTFDLDAERAAIEEQQARVLFYLLLDFLGVLVFGIYVGGRYLVTPIRALTRATERVAGGSLSPDAVPAVERPAEIARLSEAFRQMVERLRDQRDDLHRTLDQLRAAQNELVRSEKLATVGRLAAGVAHEIGNPLAAVLGYVEYLRDDRGAPPDVATDLLERIDKELHRIRGTLRQLLDFSRPAAGEPTPQDVAPLVHSAIDLVCYQRTVKDVALDVSTADATPRVLVEPAGLRQVIVNLLLNAAEAMGGRGRITVRVAADGVGCRIEVQDDGPGVPDDAAEHIFDPFFTTKPAGEGTGLGLAICRRIAEEVGGRLWYQPTEPPPGATFCVWLPAAD